MSEQTLHEAVCRYIKLQYPNVMFNSDMSGFRLTQGQAIRAKKMRSTNGYPDLVIYEARGGYFGMFIELKDEGVRTFTRDGRPATKHIGKQVETIDALSSRGYYGIIASGWDIVKNIIDYYMELEPTPETKKEISMPIYGCNFDISG